MGTKRKRSTTHTQRRNPELMEEIVMEILLRLPVKSLLRFKSVSKAWQAIIFDPIFIRAHLRHSATRWEQDPCFIISPLTLDDVVKPEEEKAKLLPTNFSNHMSFYRWRLQKQQGDRGVAMFIHAKDFKYEFTQVHDFSHCDGLVFAPTDYNLFVFNPATRQCIKLPSSDRNDLRFGRRPRCCYCTGLGLDPRTGKYKVVQAFYRSSKDRTRASMGMEVFTIARKLPNWREVMCGDYDPIWREIADDPPYPAQRHQTGLSVNGFLFFRIAKLPRALLHLSLEDEGFGITRLPDSLDPALPDDAFELDVLCGRPELCLSACTNDTTLTIWTLPIADKGLSSPWERRYSIQVSALVHPMIPIALPPFGGSGITMWQYGTIYRYDLATCELTTLCKMDRMRYQGRREREWENLYAFRVMPYTESLVGITIKCKEPWLFGAS